MKLKFRRIIAVCMVFVFLASCGCAKKKSNTIEGKGYGSPEDAALAFAEAFKEQDMDKMLSTFAIETYCSNFDTYLNMVRVRSLNISMMYNEPLAPAGEGYLKEANVYSRAGALSRNIDLLYAALISCNADPEVEEMYEEVFGGQLISVDDPEYMEDSRALLDALTGAEDLDIQVGKVYGAETIFEKYYLETNLKSAYSQAKIRNADGYKSLAVELKVNGQKSLVTMDAIKYGKKWYLCSLGGLLSMYMGMSLSTGGFVSKEEITDMGLLEDTKNKEKDAHEYLEDLEDSWNESHEEYMEEYEDLTEDLSKEEIEELIYGDDWRMDPRFNIHSLSYEEMLEFFDIDL
ncbi:MAG: hypothetical protein IKX68_07205 [Clostridiales bacterium]|nr:hypothetical protein [Clostridiales bacterium]